MKNLLSLILIFLISFTLKAEVELKAQTSEKSKNAGEMIKY